MKLVSFFLVISFLLAPPLLATDVDFYKGLNWTEVERGEAIYLLGIYPATIPENITDKPARVLAPEDYRTRYGEVLGHVMLVDGSWLQNTLVSEGKAIVMPIYERDEVRLQSLLATEDEARIARRGLWDKNTQNYPVVCAWGAKRAFDTFAIIQGPITEAANVRGTIYLNFGEDYRKDFTIKISRSIFNKLPEETQNLITRLTEGAEPVRVIEARGWVFFSGGPMIEVGTPAQIRFLEDRHPNQLGRCTS